MTVKDIDLQRVLHIHTVETLYAAVVDGYVESKGECDVARLLSELDRRR